MRHSTSNKRSTALLGEPQAKKGAQAGRLASLSKVSTNLPLVANQTREPAKLFPRMVSLTRASEVLLRSHCTYCRASTSNEPDVKIKALLLHSYTHIIR